MHSLHKYSSFTWFYRRLKPINTYFDVSKYQLFFLLFISNIIIKINFQKVFNTTTRYFSFSTILIAFHIILQNKYLGCVVTFPFILNIILLLLLIYFIVTIKYFYYFMIISIFTFYSTKWLRL